MQKLFQGNKSVFSRVGFVANNAVTATPARCYYNRRVADNSPSVSPYYQQNASNAVVSTGDSAALETVVYRELTQKAPKSTHCNFI